MYTPTKFKGIIGVKECNKKIKYRVCVKEMSRHSFNLNHSTIRNLTIDEIIMENPMFSICVFSKSDELDLRKAIPDRNVVMIKEVELV